MPTKRRRCKTSRWRITPEAAQRWQEIRPGGLNAGPPAAVIEDQRLGELVGWPALIALPEGDLMELREALEASQCR